MPAPVACVPLTTSRVRFCRPASWRKPSSLTCGAPIIRFVSLVKPSTVSKHRSVRWGPLILSEFNSVSGFNRSSPASVIGTPRGPGFAGPSALR